VAWNRRFANGLLFGVSYTLSKSMDSGSNQRDVIPNTYDPDMMWGPSGVRRSPSCSHQLSLSIAIFPAARMVSPPRHSGDGKLAHHTQFQTGLPCGVAGGNDYAGVGWTPNLGVV